MCYSNALVNHEPKFCFEPVSFLFLASFCYQNFHFEAYFEYMTLGRKVGLYMKNGKKKVAKFLAILCFKLKIERRCFHICHQFLSEDNMVFQYWIMKKTTARKNATFFSGLGDRPFNRASYFYFHLFWEPNSQPHWLLKSAIWRVYFKKVLIF